MAKPNPRHRIVLQLDPRIALEEIILNRRERIPVTRRQEWLRGLLVQGLLSECQALRGASDEAGRSPTTAFANWMVRASKNSASHPEQGPAGVKVKPAQVNTASKPFAVLGQVIG